MTSPLLGVELHLRESRLQSQRDRVTATITAQFDQIGSAPTCWWKTATSTYRSVVRISGCRSLGR